MLPATPDPIIMVSTEEGSSAVVRCACRKLCGGVCQKEWVEAGFGSPGSAAGASSVIGSGGDAASAMVLLLAVVALAVGGRRAKWIGSGEAGWWTLIVDSSSWACEQTNPSPTWAGPGHPCT